MALTIESVLIGAAFGVGTSLLGLVKNKVDESKPPEDREINLAKAAPTFILTTLAGIYMAVNEMPFNDAVMGTVITGFASVGLADWLDKAIKAILKKFGK